MREVSVVPVFERPYAGLGHYFCKGPGCRARHEEAVPYASFAFPTTGVFVKRDAGGEALLDNTRAALFNPGQPFEVDHPLGVPDHCWFVELYDHAFAGAWAAFGAEDFYWKGEPFPAPAVSLGPKAWLDVAERGRVLFDPAGDDLTRSESIFHMLAVLLSAAYGEEKVARRQPKGAAQKVRAAQLELQQNFRERLTLEGLARRARLSAFHLCRAFKRETGFTIHQTLMRLRLRQSLEDLKERGASVTEVALALGFSSHSHFTATFTKTFGLAPSVFRARCV